MVVVGWTSILRSVLSMLYLKATCTSFNYHHYSQQGACDSVCWSRVPEHVKLCRNPFRFQVRSLTIDNPEHENPGCFVLQRFHKNSEILYSRSVTTTSDIMTMVEMLELFVTFDMYYLLSEIEIRNSPYGAKSI